MNRPIKQHKNQFTQFISIERIPSRERERDLRQIVELACEIEVEQDFMKKREKTEDERSVQVLHHSSDNCTAVVRRECVCVCVGATCPAVTSPLSGQDPFFPPAFGAHPGFISVPHPSPLSGYMTCRSVKASDATLRTKAAPFF